MSPVEEYLATVPPAERAEFQRIGAIVRRLVPDAAEGVSYAMPAYLHRGKPLLSAIVNKRFLSIYPFSGKVIEKLREDLKGFECTSGSIHFSVESPLPTDLLEKIIAARLHEIDTPTPKP